MGTAFPSPRHTAGGGCCAHKQDGAVPAEAEGLLGQLDGSEDVYRDLLVTGNAFGSKQES